MTYPDMTAWQRQRAAQQFRLMRLGLAYHRRQEKDEPSPPDYIRTFRLARRLAIHAELNAVRAMLHRLFD